MKNLLVFTFDEMRGDCLGLNGRNPDLRTPHLDALARRGVNLPRHFTTFPKCVPARVSITTGRYCHTDGFRTIYQHLPADQPDLLAKLLQRDYQVALFGKNHCWENIFEASHTPPTLLPGQHGHRIHAHSWTKGYHDIYDRYRRDHGASPEEEEKPGGNGLSIYQRNFPGHPTDDAYFEQAAYFLEHDRDTTRPFYLHVNFEAPHTPYAVEEPWYSLHDRQQIRQFPSALPRGAPQSLLRQREIRLGHEIDDLALREIQAVYYGMIAKLDQRIGEFTQLLDRLALWENTVILFYSDHGDFAGQYGIWEKWDTSFYDCLVHVPCFFIAEPLAAGTDLQGLTDHTDLAPTLCSLLGLEPWPGMHGHDLTPCLCEGRPSPREAVFADGGHEAEMRRRVDPIVSQIDREGRVRRVDKNEVYVRYPETMARAKMVRTATHKLVFRETGDHELYDLALDPWELDNRYADPDLREKREHLHQLLLHWCLRTDTDRPPQERVFA